MAEGLKLRHKLSACRQKRGFNAGFIVPRLKPLPCTKGPCRHSIQCVWRKQEIDLKRPATIIIMLKWAYSQRSRKQGNEGKKNVFHLSLLKVDLQLFDA